MSLEEQLVDTVVQTVKSQPRRGRLWVGLSGGLDSMVLLHVLHRAKPRLTQSIGAIHVNHQISPWADTWESHTRKIAVKLEMQSVAERVKVAPEAGESLEACARDLRYQAFRKHVKANDALLTAHHADDQCETMLHHLFCGSGIKGLAAMRRVSKLLNIAHMRPFLNIGRSDLETYADEKGLIWVDDESNDDTRLRRNYIRHEVIPVLEREFLGVKKTLLRVINHAANADELLDELAQIDLKACMTETASILDTTPFKKLSASRIRNLLRYWFCRQKVRLPSEKKLESILRNVIRAGLDTSPIETWDSVAIRRYRNELHLLTEALPETRALCFEWDPACVLKLPEGLGELSLEGQIESQQFATLIVRFRTEGETLHASEAFGPQSVKKLLQNSAIPPWKRSLIPLVYSEDGELLSIPGVRKSIQFDKYLGEGSRIEWRYSNYFEAI